MVALLELKEKLKRVYSQYDIYIVPSAKFLLSLVSLLLLNASIGYMSKIKNPIIAVLIAAICAFLPNGATVVLLSVFMLAHLYAISAELAVVAACVVVLMYLLYFSFAPKTGYILIITAILCALKLPYLVPIAVGLTCGISSIIPVSFGVIIYYIIKTASDYETAISTQTVSNSMQKFSFIVDSILNNKEMILLVLAFAVAIIAVYGVRRRSIDNAWTYAIATGAVVQFLILVVGKIALSAKINIIFVIIGTILAVVIGYLCEVLFFSVDYKRTECVQYEDDEYYYYVKAVPKVNIVNEDVKVKRINAQKVKKTDDITTHRRPESKPARRPIDVTEDEDDGITLLDK